jgi:hypothetical protein
VAPISSCTRILPRASERERSWLSNGQRPPLLFNSRSWLTRVQRRARPSRSTLCEFEENGMYDQVAHVTRAELIRGKTVKFKSDIIPICALPTRSHFTLPAHPSAHRLIRLSFRLQCPASRSRSSCRPTLTPFKFRSPTRLRLRTSSLRYPSPVPADQK